MLPLGMPNHTHHEPLWLFSPIEPAKTCWDTLYFDLYTCFLLQANDKANIMNELDAAQSKVKKSEDLEHDLKQQLLGWVHHLPLNQQQYQTFLTNAQRLEEKLFNFLVLTETKKIFLKIMAMVGFGYQPMVLWYVLPWYLNPFPY